MELITGALFTLCCVLLYDRFKPHKAKEVEKVDEAEKELQKRYNEHFEALLNYTPEKAYKKVVK